MIRIFKYDKPTEYKDFENYVFSNLSRSFFDLPNDKVILDATTYKISTASFIEDDDDDNTGTLYSGVSEVKVGAISVGDTFTEANLQEMFDALLKQEQFPVLSSPSSTFILTETGIYEINQIIPILHFISSFNRGEINPAYGTNGYRSGLPNSYNYTGVGLSNNASTLLTDNQEVNNYSVVEGTQSWVGSIVYDEGEQPKSSYDNNYNTPLPTGETLQISRSITGVYPLFATTEDIAVVTKQPLVLHDAIYFEFDMVAENDVDKQIVDFSASHLTITGIQAYNTVSNSWEWLGGSKANSLSVFNTNTVTHVVQGDTISYTRYVHNGVKTGARGLRFFTN